LTTQPAALAAAAAQLAQRYARPDWRRGLGQIATSILPALLMWPLLIASASLSYGLTLLLAFPAAGFLVRTFIIQHDCGHGSFLPSRRANEILGAICGVFTLTPFRHWRRQHNIHHAHAGKLEHRGWHYVPTLTVQEYRSLPSWKRLLYRLFRHPVVLFGVVAPLYFLVLNRFAYSTPEDRFAERRSVVWTNVAIVAVYGSAAAVLGAANFAAVALPVYAIAGAAGFWLFYVQHEFEDTYFAAEDEWDYFRAALAGSSYYRLPRLLQWFTGNIGLHHVHHLGPRIPNYYLQRCHDENDWLHGATTFDLASSLSLASLKLWDEERRKLVPFSAA
jgi:omega-6 fatty acid desaturase (delta-12 desaturase)